MERERYMHQVNNAGMHQYTNAAEKKILEDEEVDIFTDGSLKVPTKRFLALGGYGIWYKPGLRNHDAFTQAESRYSHWHWLGGLASLRDALSVSHRPGMHACAHG